MKLTKIRNFICPICGKGCYSKVHFLSHKAKSHGDVCEYYCRECPQKKFKNHAGARSHIIKHHSGEKPYECNICGLQRDYKGVKNYH